MALKKEDIIKSLEEMKLTELNELVKAIEEHFGVVAAATVAAPAGAADEEDEKSDFDIMLTEIGQQKVGVIKLVGKLTGKGLMDAKKMIDKLPVLIKEKVNQEEAEEIKNDFINAGATVELK